MVGASSKLNILLLLFLIILVAVISIFYPLIAIFLVGAIIYISLIGTLTKPTVFKKILIISLVMMIFQDTVVSFITSYNTTLGDGLNNFDELLILFMIPIVFINNYKKKNINIGILELSLIMILILGVASSFLNHVPFNISMLGAILMLKGYLVFYIFKSTPFEEKDLVKIRKIFLYVFVVVLIGSIIDLLFPYWLRGVLNTENKYDYRGGIISIQSIFIHPGVYGWFMVFIGLYFLSYSRVFKKKAIGILSLITFAFAFISFRFKVVMSITGVIFYTYLRMGIRRVFLGLLPLSLLILVIWYLIGDDLTSLMQLTVSRYLDPYYLDSARKALYVVGFMISINEFPFGVGWGRFGGWIARTEYSPVYYEYGLNNVYGLNPVNPMWATDTYWPYIVGEIGLIGAALLLTTFLYFILIIRKGFKRVKSNEKKVFLLFSILVIIQSILESLGEQVYNSAPQYFYIFGVIGIAFSIIRSDREV